MTDLARLRSDLRTFSLAIEQPLADWQADSLTLERRTTVIVAPRTIATSLLPRQLPENANDPGNSGPFGTRLLWAILGSKEENGVL